MSGGAGPEGPRDGLTIQAPVARASGSESAFVRYSSAAPSVGRTGTRRDPEERIYSLGVDLARSTGPPPRTPIRSRKAPRPGTGGGVPGLGRLTRTFRPGPDGPLPPGERGPLGDQPWSASPWRETRTSILRR